MLGGGGGADLVRGRGDGSREDRQCGIVRTWLLPHVRETWGEAGAATRHALTFIPATASKLLQGPRSGRAKRRQQGDREREAAGTALLLSGASTTTRATQ